MNKIELDDKSKGLLNGIENMLKRISNFVIPKNIIVTDVNGVELDFGTVQTQEEIAEGVTATADGSPADGEYVLNDGTVYVFEAGTLTQINVPEDVEALKQKIEDLTQQLEASNSENAEAQNKLKEFQKKAETDFNIIKKELNDFKALFTEENVPRNNPGTGGKVNRINDLKNK